MFFLLNNLIIQSSLINNLNSRSCSAILLWALLLFPFLGFSQQEQPKRVAIVVSVKEISAQKEIVQIPADNAPKAVSKASTPVSTRKSTAPKKENTSTPAKAPAVVRKETVSPTNNIAKSNANTKPSAKTNAKPVATPKPQATTTPKIAQSKPVVKETEKPIEAKPAIAAEASDENITEQPKTAQVDTSATKINEELAEERYNAKSTSSFSYVWIGIFLTIAGVVLGLLFGRPAFLISFVGIVFVIIGLII